MLSLIVFPIAARLRLSDDNSHARSFLPFFGCCFEYAMLAPAGMLLTMSTGKSRLP